MAAEQDRIAELAATTLFAGIPAALLAPVVSAAYPRRFSRGQIVFVAGEPGDALYLVREGRVKVATTSVHGDELVLTVLGAGDVFGEVSLLDGGPRSAGAEALEPTELLAVPAEAARRVLLAHPEALLRMAAELAAGMRRLTGTAGDLVFLDLPRRLAKLLLAGVHDHTPSRPPSQSELAAMLGASRQTVNRALARLQQRGWITADAGVITVVDAVALGHFAGD